MRRRRQMVTLTETYPALGAIDVRFSPHRRQYDGYDLTYEG
jgi:hypothetical protein